MWRTYPGGASPDAWFKPFFSGCVAVFHLHHPLTSLSLAPSVYKLAPSAYECNARIQGVLRASLAPNDHGACREYRVCRMQGERRDGDGSEGSALAASRNARGSVGFASLCTSATTTPAFFLIQYPLHDSSCSTFRNFPLDKRIKLR